MSTRVVPAASDDAPGKLFERAALQSIPGLTVLVFDADLRYRDVFGGAAARHGYDVPTLIGRYISEVLPEEALSQVVPPLRAALSGHTTTATVRSLDGTATYDTTYAPIVADSEVVGVVASMTEATGERVRLAELTQSQEIHQLVTGRAGDAITMVDQNGRYTWVSDTVQAVLGYPPGQLLGQPVRNFYHPADVATAASCFSRLVDGEEAVTCQYRYRRPDGSWLWVETRARALRDPDGGFAGALGVVRDISEQHALHQRLADAHRLFETSFNAAPIGKALTSPDGRWLKVNPALCTIVGLDEPALLATTFQAITHPDDLAKDLRLLEETRAGERQGYRIDKRYVRPDGTIVWVQLDVAAVRDESGTVSFFVAQVQDISNRKRTEEELLRRATYDELTGLWNRWRLIDQLESSLAEAQRYPRRPILLAVDIDGFKAVNDQHGHATGDEHLKEIAHVLRTTTRSSDYCARMGGDEFVVLLQEIDLADAQRLADRIAARIAGLGRGTSASIGIAPWHTGLTADTWINEADHAMYAVKRTRRPARG